MVLKAELKSTNSNLTYESFLSRCVRAEWRAEQMASSEDRLARNDGGSLETRGDDGLLQGNVKDVREDTRQLPSAVLQRSTRDVVRARHLTGASGQRVKVEPEVLSYPGQTVNLRCAFTDTTDIQLTLVTWIYKPKEGGRENIAVLHPKYGPTYPESPLKERISFTQGPPNMDSPSIQISDVRMTDEGEYICVVASYPGGNKQGITQLVMLTKPQNSASALTVEAGRNPTVVARCQSLNGRPEAQIRWVTTVDGNASTSSQPGQDNTVSVSSEYRLAPTAADNGKDISCVVSHRTQTSPESFQMKLNVLCKRPKWLVSLVPLQAGWSPLCFLSADTPQVTIVGYDNNWYVGRTNVLLTCQATGNPVPTTVLWKSMTGAMPDTVQLKDNQLKVLKVDEAVNTTFVCEVKNRIGTGRDQVTALVREPSVNPSNAGVVAAVVIVSLLALLLVAALVAVLMTRNRRRQQGYRADGSADLKARIFGGGKNGTGGAGNNNAPIYVYDDGSAHQGEKNNHNGNGRLEVVTATPTAQDILLSGELDDAERRKFDELEEEERYDRFASGGAAPILQLRPAGEQHEMIGDYLDDDMESQRDGSVISRTAVYV
ncbi:poliovirus receptor isoform X1 [Syngnathus scovelli]|uniref:poliovirus receptor isoform X1 n=1 Tax=Syngnathus scovelli TaxID=161590 RepID=UPI0035C959AB